MYVCMCIYIYTHTHWLWMNHTILSCQPGQLDQPSDWAFVMAGDAKGVFVGKQRGKRQEIIPKDWDRSWYEVMKHHKASKSVTIWRETNKRGAHLGRQNGFIRNCNELRETSKSAKEIRGNFSPRSTSIQCFRLLTTWCGPSVELLKTNEIQPYGTNSISKDTAKQIAILSTNAQFYKNVGAHKVNKQYSSD